MKRLLVYSLVWATALLATGQTVVTQYVPGITAEGVTYYLPRTELVVTLQAKRVTKKPGDFKEYAARYLRVDDAVQEETTEWSLEGVWITPVGVPDKDKVYSVVLNKKTVAPLVELTSDGIILSINTQGEKEEADFPELVNETTNDRLNSREYLTEEILSAGNRQKMAELCCEEIYDLRENRNLLIKGQADFQPGDGKQLELMLAELETQERALLQLFTGTTETEVRTIQIVCNPTETVQKEVLFRFSKRFGIVDKDDLSGEPVYVDIVDLETVPERAETAEGKLSRDLQDAVRYNVPGNAAIEIYDGSKTYATLQTPLAQFGETEVLSTSLFNKRYTTRVTFSSTTGALKRLTDVAQ